MGRTIIRAGITLLGAVMGLLAIALFWRLVPAREFWPWPAYDQALTPLSYCFLASIAAALCAPILWIGLSGRLNAAAPGALNLTVAFIGIGLFMSTGYLADPSNDRLLFGSIAMWGVVASSVVVWLLGRNVRSADARPMPFPVRVSFVIFVIALVWVGGSLVLQRPGVLPWDVSPEASVVYGWIFLGAAVYFVFALVRPTWENAMGQLMGFLAYDIVLIGPFLAHFADVRPEQVLSLVLYTAVVTYSGLLAIAYLFVVPETRVVGARPASG